MSVFISYQQCVEMHCSGYAHALDEAVLFQGLVAHIKLFRQYARIVKAPDGFVRGDPDILEVLVALDDMPQRLITGWRALDFE